MRATYFLWAGWLPLALFAWATPAAAEESPDARLARLERTLEAQAAEIQRLSRQGPSAPPGTVALPSATRTAAPIVDQPFLAPLPDGSSLSPGSGGTSGGTAHDVLGTTTARRQYRGQLGGVRIGGYLTLEFVANSTKNSYFDLHRFILQISAPIGERIGLNTEIEFEHGGVDESYLDGEIKIEYLEVMFQVADAFNPKLGALLIPFGRFNLYHDDPLNDFTMRPLTGRYLIPAGFGQPGIGAEGVFGLGCVGGLTYNVAATAGFDDEITTKSGVRDARQAWQRDNNDSKQIWGRLAGLLNVPRTDNFEIGVSGTWGKYDDQDRHVLAGFAADFNIQAGPFQFQGEYLQYDMEREPSAPPGAPRRQSGLWLEGAYHFFPCGWNCPRPPFVTYTSHFTLAFRYQELDLNNRLTGGSFFDDVKTYGVGLNYRITEDMVFRVDWTYFDAATDEDRREFTASFSTYF